MEVVPQTMRRLGDGSAASRIRRAAALLERHGAEFRRTARRYSICETDAEDALQRASEILLTRAPGPDPRGNLVGWMHVVTRREAMAVNRARRRQLSPCAAGNEPLDPDRLRSDRADPQQQLEYSERVAEAARSLGRLKPAERRAIALQAAGCSYAEICAITGWTYTKVNRCLAEGRETLRRLGSLAPPA